MQPVVGIYDANQNLVKEFGDDGGRETNDVCVHSLHKAAPTTSVSPTTRRAVIADTSIASRSDGFRWPWRRIRWACKKATTAEIHLDGYNLGADKIAVKGEPSPEDMRAVIFRPRTPKGPAFNRVKLALGTEPEVPGCRARTRLSRRRRRSAIPVTVNGKLEAAENYYRFHARKGEKLVFEVNANRLGSPLDSMIEILDTQGRARRARHACAACLKPPSRSPNAIPRIAVSASLRRPGFAVGDYMMIGAEIIQVEAMPRGPDDDFFFTGFGGQRLAYLDTTPEAHAIDQAVYKVQIHPPGRQFAPNGLPVVHLTVSQ